MQELNACCCCRWMLGTIHFRTFVFVHTILKRNNQPFLKTNINLCYIQNSVPTSQKTLRPYYKDQLFTYVHENNPLLWKYRMYKNVLCVVNKQLLGPNATIHVVNTDIWGDKTHKNRIISPVLVHVWNTGTKISNYCRLNKVLTSRGEYSTDQNNDTTSI